MKKLDRQYVQKTMKSILEKADKFKYPLIMLIFGVCLMLLPSGSGKNENRTAEKATEENTCGFTLSDVEIKLEAILADIDGAGKVRVMLSLSSDGEKIIARDEETSKSSDGGGSISEELNVSSVIISTGSGTEETVVTKYIYPEFMGAVVLAQGAGSARVKLDISNAVSAITGLSADKISVIKMK